MEKRLVLFVMLSFAIMYFYANLRARFAPPPQPKANQPLDQVEDPVPGQFPVAEQADDVGGPDGPKEGDDQPQQTLDTQQLVDTGDDQEQPDQASPSEILVARERSVLGSIDPQSPYGMQVIIDNRGAAIESIELNDPRYRSLADVGDHSRYEQAKSGYLGFLAPSDVPGGGCQVNVVGDGTPASKAECTDSDVARGMLPGDVIKSLAGAEIEDVVSFRDRLKRTSEGIYSLVVERVIGDEKRELTFQVELTRPPQSVVYCQPDSSLSAGRTDLSYLMTLDQVAGRRLSEKDRAALANFNWNLVERPGDGKPTVALSIRLDPETLSPVLEGGIQIVRRFSLARSEDSKSQEGVNAALYHLTMDIEIHNDELTDTSVSYELSGPNNLPLEGWWYIAKIHPEWFHTAGTRDVIWRTTEGLHELYGCKDLVEYKEENPNNRGLPLFANQASVELVYAGVDTQYFLSALMASKRAPEDFSPPTFAAARAKPFGKIDTQRVTRTDVSFELVSTRHDLSAGEKLKQRFDVFAGPKQPEILEHYRLQDTIVYGMFSFVVKPMVWLLHLFYKIVPNYGLAIIMLTVLVRGCMFPLGRKQAAMAAKMQELAPEMKRIAEKYKNDMEKRAKAQQDLFKKHNYNPLSGCLPMFLQLPIFIGLYRALSLDIELRDAPLIPGIEWCSNLASPDRLLYWESFMPSFVGSQTGFLGPYLNVLPLITICFFMVHQKLFTPPATDDQSAMQMKIMKFMMLFMGFLFFRVAAGLCLYIIASSAWGVGERLLLPKKKKPEDSKAESSPRSVKSSNPSGNGASKSSGKLQKKAKGKR